MGRVRWRPTHAGTVPLQAVLESSTRSQSRMLRNKDLQKSVCNAVPARILGTFTMPQPFPFLAIRVCPPAARGQRIANSNSMLGTCAIKCSARVALRALGELVRPTFSFCIYLHTSAKFVCSFCAYNGQRCLAHSLLHRNVLPK